MSAALVAGQGFFYNQFPGNVVRDPRQNRGMKKFDKNKEGNGGGFEIYCKSSLGGGW